MPKALARERFIELVHALGFHGPGAVDECAQRRHIRDPSSGLLFPQHVPGTQADADNRTSDGEHKRSLIQVRSPEPICGRKMSGPEIRDQGPELMGLKDQPGSRKDGDDKGGNPGDSNGQSRPHQRLLPGQVLRLPPDQGRVWQGAEFVRCELRAFPQKLGDQQDFGADRAAAGVTENLGVTRATAEPGNYLLFLFAKVFIHTPTSGPEPRGLPMRTASLRRARRSSRRMLPAFSPVESAISLWLEPSTYASQSNWRSRSLSRRKACRISILRSGWGAGDATSEIGSGRESSLWRRQRSRKRLVAMRKR